MDALVRQLSEVKIALKTPLVELPLSFVVVNNMYCNYKKLVQKLEPLTTHI